ncbi:class I SAM-dependent methyltransferase [Dactylosporangium sp. NPDC000521]|uniref:class I SAM-dependent methyltransferase n=1 Tax=Dactylosporangium sp. NPDC000521 TaxID=3363975 RepID=UPI0036775D05
MSGEHYFTAEPAAAETRHTVEFTVDDQDFRLVASAGVFSAHRLDPGTAVLLQRAPLPDAAETGPLLDLGCGYGPIAAVLSSRAPRATIYAVDVNQRALELARENTGPNVITTLPGDVPDSVGFTQIWSNPPIRIGKPELHALLLRWLPRLAPDGVAWLVVAKNLGADSLQRWLEEQGFSAVRHANHKGFRIFEVRKAGDGPASAAQNS